MFHFTQQLLLVNSQQDIPLHSTRFGMHNNTEVPKIIIELLQINQALAQVLQIQALSEHRINCQRNE